MRICVPVVLANPIHNTKRISLPKKFAFLGYLLMEI